MSNIQNYLNHISTKEWASEVRTAIVNAIRECYNNTEDPELRTEALEAAIQAKIDAGQMAALTIGDGTITAVKLASNSVTTSKIADGNVTTPKIANGSVTAEKLDPNMELVTIDATLSNSGEAADAKVVGDAISELNGSLDDVDNALGWESVGTADASNDFVYPYHSAQSVRVATEANADISIHGITVNDFTTLINPTYDHIEEIESEVGRTYRITDISTNDGDFDYRVVSRFEGFTVGKSYRICLKITDPQNNVSGGGHYAAVMVGMTTKKTIGKTITEEQIYASGAFTANSSSLNVYIYPFRGINGMAHYEHAVGDTFRIDDFYINEINSDVDILTHEKVFQSSATGTKLTYVVSGEMFVIRSTQSANIGISKAVGRILTINGEAPDATGNMLIKSHIQQKMCVCFGDSITLKGSESYIDYPYLLGEITGLNVINCGIGGTSMRYRTNYDNWNMVSFAHMADMIVSGDFSDIQARGNTSGFEMKDVCQRLYPIISAIDWEDVDFITIAYGANDHATSAMSNVNYLDNETDKQDVFTYLGAFRYAINKILTAYPHIKFIVLTPVFRYWTIDGQEVTSDSRVFNDGTYYYEWGDALKLCAEKELHIPVCDMYNELCINNYNYSWFSGDGVHPTLTGLERMAHKLAGCIMSKF